MNMTYLTLSAGAGKQIYLHYGYHSFKCFLRRRNSTEQSHDNTYG